MLIIGEKLNSSIPKTGEALATRDENYFISVIKAQAEAGADYLDINTAIFKNEESELLLWLIGLAIEHSECKIMIDSPNPEAIKKAAPAAAERGFIINSATLTERFDELLEVALKYKSGIVILPMADSGIPDTADKRADNARLAVEKLRKAGVSPDNIYIDAMTEAVSVSESGALVTLDTIRKVKEICPDVNTICGLSNVSFGLPKRSFLNASFLSMAILCGLDSVIMDVLPINGLPAPSLFSSLYASLALSGRDEYCGDYIRYVRKLKNKETQ